MSLWARFVIAMAALIAVTAAAVGSLSYNHLRDLVVPRELDRMALHLQVTSAPLPAIVNAAADDVLVAAASSAARGVVRAGHNGGIDPVDGVAGTVWRERLAAIFLRQMSAEPRYLQFRLIGNDDGGREIVRVERKAGKLQMTPRDELQQKGDRDYFRQAITLQDGAISVSPIELNVERGEIEDPPQPVIRVSTPMLAEDGEPFGILIINVDLAAIFTDMEAEMEPDRSLYVVNAQGDYLLSPDRTHDFAFQRGSGTARIGDDFPVLASVIAARQTLAEVTEDNAGEAFGVVLKPVTLAGTGPIFVAEAIPYETLTAVAERAQQPILIGALVATCGAIVIALLLARGLVRPIREMTVAAEAMERGETPILPTRASGEIGTLARAFKSMATEVADKRASLSKALAEQRRINAELHEKSARERLLGMAVDTSDDAIIIHDLEGRIQTWNEAATRLYGYGQDEVVGQRTELIIPPDRHDEFYDLLEKVRAGERVRHFETVRLTKGGERVDVSLSISPVRDETGELIGASKIARDITERKRADAERATRTEELARSNSELEQFAYIAAHDLQEPLRMVASYTELLSQRYQGQLDERADKYIGYAVDGAKRMKLLINDLLAFSRVKSQGQPFADVDTEALLRSVVASLRGAIEASGARVEVNDMPNVTGDEVQLGQVFQNLIGNAIKFHSGEPPNIYVRAKKRDGVWVFSVADNGIGIDRKFAERIFQMFQRLHERGRYEGSGIGLAISKKIVERHGGKIWFESSPGIGTTFYFTIPAA
ncbi:PAS domain S-box protein [Jiella endophytica]|uniref:histidine kinase n=1 Tax=Jiella endophytica TaxID=2558362 RepID=A0A4Y8RAI1_9HYPH|nr:ATP-binding protein [Jiella endophytica]TFF18040.1 PAS domain S-box protein [Jiella endophytica]